MSISVVYNASGDIVAASEGSVHTGATSTVELVAGPGEHLGHFDVPAKHAGKKFTEFAHLLRVNTGGAAAHLEDK